VNFDFENHLRDKIPRKRAKFAKVSSFKVILHKDNKYEFIKNVSNNKPNLAILLF